MKRWLVLVAAGMVMMAGCSTMSHHHAAAPSTRPISAAINTHCAVNPKDLVDPQYMTIYQGKTVRFCCPDCKAAFEKDPEKYMKDLR